MSCVCKRQWLYKHTVVIRSINLNKYDIKCLKGVVDNFDMKYIVTISSRIVMLSYGMSRGGGNQRMTYRLK